MARLPRIMFWRCRHCGHTNRLQIVSAEYEPAAFTCEQCGEDSTVQLQDLSEAATKINIRKLHKRPHESDAEDS